MPIFGVSQNNFAFMFMLIYYCINRNIILVTRVSAQYKVQAISFSSFFTKNSIFSNFI